MKQFSGCIHFFLDVVGLLPGVGVAADILNAGIYLAQGDKVGAAISAAAAIPIVGGAVAIGAKAGKAFGKKVLKSAAKKIAKTKPGKAIKKFVKKQAKKLKRTSKKIAKKAQKKSYNKKTVSKYIKKDLKKQVKKKNTKYKKKSKKELQRYKKKFWPYTKRVPEKGFDKWQDAEKYLREFVKGGPQSFRTATGELRKVDALAGGIAHKLKMGYASLTNFIKKQIDKDVALIKEEKIIGAKWHFFRSGKTGKIGASKQLLAYLKKNGIEYEIHK